MTNRLGTCCMVGEVIDGNFKSFKGTTIGTVQQSALDKLMGFDKNSDITRSEHLSSISNIKLSLLKQKLYSKVKANITSLYKQLEVISNYNLNMKMFRISSGLLPMFDHPDYNILYDHELKTVIEAGLKRCRRLIDINNIIVTTHPDKFTVINSDKKEVRLKSFRTLEYHKWFMERLTTYDKTSINIHLNGKLDHIPEFDNGEFSELKPWLSFENDDIIVRAGVIPTLEICEKYNIKMVYDIHHHLVELENDFLLLPRYTNSELIKRIVRTWKGETPIFHVSTSKNSKGTTKKELSPHSDTIDNAFFFVVVRNLLEIAHFEVEAKHKNVATDLLYTVTRKY